MKATWQGWWWWRALAWGLVAVVVLALLVSLWVFESDTPDDRCWQLPSSLTGTATGDFLALPLGNTQNLPNYKLLYQYPDHVSTYTQQMLEIGGVVDDFINWVWWRTLSALRDPMTGPKAVVLFVHGHGGSGRQVKELSVILQSLRPTLVDKPDHHAQLAVFSVHFAGELSALQGDVLRRQAAFVNTCIRYILNSLYPIPRPPKIVLVGHSMGGVVARAALTLPNNYAKSITALITLGAPLQTSLWPFDPSLVSFYHDLNTYHPPPNESVPTFSIAGGLRDHLIRTELSAFYGIEPAEQRLERGYAFTTAIPRVWTSIDHDSLLTCGQFVAVLGRCIMDIVNRTAARYYSSPHEQVFAAYRRHFLSPLPRLLGVKSSPEGLDMLLDDAQARPRVPESNATRNDTNANANATITDPTSFTPPPPPPLVEIINHTGQYLLLSGLANHTQIHNFSLPTWRARFGQMQLLVVTNLPPHVLRASLASNGTDVSIPDHWWIEPPVGYVPEAFRTSGIRDHAAHSDSPPESPKASPAPRMLVLPARLLSQRESLLVHLSLSAPDPLNVMNNVTTEQPDAGSSFVFVQLYSEYGAQVPVFDEDGGTFTLSTLDEGAEDASTASSSDRGLRPAVAHFVLPGHMQPISVYVRPITGGGSAPSSAGPRWQPLIYQYSTCSAYMFEEENVYVDTSPAFIRSHYRTIPQLYRECGNATTGSVVHLFLFTDPHHYYEVEIEPHVWVAVGHLFSSFVTLSLPSAFFIFALVFAVQRLAFARSGSLPSFAWVLLRWVAPAVVSVALVVSGALYAFDPPWYLLHESALVFASLPVMTPSFAFSHDPVANTKMPPLAPIVVVTYGILLVMVYALLQVFLVSCARPLTLRLVDRAREAIKQRKLCKCLNLGRVTQWDCRCVSAWPRSRFVLGWLVKAALAVLFVEAALRAPFYLSILAALVLTLVPAKDEPLSLFRQSLSVLLALLSTYHFGCLWFSWAATHPFDESAAFTLPTLALALFVSLLRRLPQAPLLHYSLAAVGAATAIYLCVFCWHAVHMIVYAIAGLSACALLGLASALLWSWLTVAALMLSGSTTIPQEEGDGEAAASAPVVATDTDQAAANDSVVRPFAALRRLYRRVFVFSLLRHRTEVLGLRPNEQDPNPENEEGGSAVSLHELHPL